MLINISLVLRKAGYKTGALAFLSASRLEVNLTAIESLDWEDRSKRRDERAESDNKVEGRMQ